MKITRTSVREIDPTQSGLPYVRRAPIEVDFNW